MASVSSDKAVASEAARDIARVAARLFAAQGYDATPVRTIAEAAGVTKPTLYYYFGSKEGVAQALLTVPLTGLVESLRSLADAKGDPEEVLERCFEAHFAFCREDPDRARFYYALCFGPHGSSAMAQELLRFTSEMDNQVLAIVRRLADAGVIPAERVEVCAKTFRGLVVMSTMDFLYKGEELGPDLAHRLVGGLLWGFGIPGPAGRGC